MSQSDNGRQGPPRRQLYDQDADPRNRGAQGAPRPSSGASGRQPYRAGGPPTMYLSGGPSKASQQTKTASRTAQRPKTQNPKQKKRKSKGLVAGIIAASLALVLLVGGLSAYGILAKQIDGERTQAGKLPEDVKTLPEYTGKGVIRMLICGIAFSDADDTVGNTDMILYMVYDTENNKVRLLQIPRDVYVGNNVNAGPHCKINGLYFNSSDPDNRMAPLARVINDQLGLPVDYYVTINVDAMKEIVDIKGDIKVYVPIDVNYTDEATGEYSIIEQGWRHLDSAQVEYFVRNRHSTTYEEKGDIMRLQMQQSFYSALFREFKTLTPQDLLMWMKVLLYRCTTDMDPLQLGGLAQKALNLQGGDITFVRPPVSGAAFVMDSGEKVSLVSLVPEGTADLLNEYFRPEGQMLTVNDLDIRTLPVVETIGIHEASIRTMADVQAEEPAADT